ncbi:hypothetical protein [Pelagicoccus sp. SDUM812002]|uniref:hypothetical protein n=1 Tax=Pelagicoccus sp. SDUM812002 TaxID=3041266 RepID=UPI00280E1C2B|nr:hypothetical protein [Pelagicoccus sp. SDUM812002]MDQ8185934.1 hypothetical protein [Pelagicoccus sp. SDUM812002]
MLARLKWLTFLSLDAPLVAVTWQVLFAKEQGIRLAWYHSAIVFLSVWLGYAADRWCDNLKGHQPLSQQHAFYAKHSSRILAVWISVLVLASSLAFLKLNRPQLIHGFVLMGIALAYSVFAQKGRQLPFYALAKSSLTALLVLASSLLFLPFTASSYLTAIYVWMLFTSNCLYIRSWTHSGEQKAARRAGILAILVGLTTVLAFWARDSQVAAATFLAQSGIVALHLFQHRFEIPTLRISADLCLLSPLLFVAF